MPFVIIDTWPLDVALSVVTILESIPLLVLVITRHFRHCTTTGTC